MGALERSIDLLVMEIERNAEENRQNGSDEEPVTSESNPTDDRIDDNEALDDSEVIEKKVEEAEEMETCDGKSEANKNGCDPEDAVTKSVDNDDEDMKKDDTEDDEEKT